MLMNVENVLKSSPMRKRLTPEIIFEDQHLVVVMKPAGLLSQGEKTGDDNLVDWLRDYFGRHYVGLIHRLDRNTSGLMVVAKRTKSARRLTESLQKGEVKRIYQAWVNGRISRRATWSHWMLKDEDRNQSVIVESGTQGAKLAKLSVKPLEHKQQSGVTFTLAEFRLQTGRSHQIRAQSSAMGHSVCGDVKYAKETKKKFKSKKRLLLHASQLLFPHPMTGEVLRFQASLPDDMIDIYI